jgi:uncharacterized protein (TIGR03067 family)
MKSLLATALLLGLQPPTETPDDEALRNAELDKLAGTWAVTSGEKNGQKLAPEQTDKYRLVINVRNKESPKIEAYDLNELRKQPRDRKAVNSATFKIDPTVKPNDPAHRHKTIDLVRYKDGQEMTMLGIYDLKGEMLTICGCDDGRRIRPSEFAAKADSGCSLLVLKREKK